MRVPYVEEGGILTLAGWTSPCGRDHLYNCTCSQSVVLLWCVAIQLYLRKLFENYLLIPTSALASSRRVTQQEFARSPFETVAGFASQPVPRSSVALASLSWAHVSLIAILTLAVHLRLYHSSRENSDAEICQAQLMGLCINDANTMSSLSG